MEAATFARWFEAKSPVLRKQVLSKHFWRLDKPGRPEGRTAFCPRSPQGLSETACRGREPAGDAGIRDREIGVKGRACQGSWEPGEGCPSGQRPDSWDSFNWKV